MMCRCAICLRSDVAAVFPTFVRIVAQMIAILRVIDSHTAGEPTRVIIEGGPDLGTGSMAERREHFPRAFAHFPTPVVNTPLGPPPVPRALHCEPLDPPPPPA